MSIKPFAESLLTDVRERNQRERDRIRKERERQERMGLVVGIGTAIGNKFLEKKTNDFLKSEPFLKDDLLFKRNFKQAKKDDEDYLAYQQNPDYFIQEYTKRFTPAYTSYADANDSLKNVNETILMNAQAHSEQRINELEKRINEARKFIAMAGDDEGAYRQSIIDSRPANVQDAFIKGLGNFITGGSLNDAALQTDLIKNSKTYGELYKQNPTLALSSEQMLQQLKSKGVKFEDAPITYGKRETIKKTNAFGDPVETSVLPLIQNKVVIGYLDENTGQRVAYYSTSQEQRKDVAAAVVAQSIPGGVVSEKNLGLLKASILGNVTPKQRKTMENQVKETYGTKTDDEAALNGAIRIYYSNIELNNQLFQKRFNLSSREATALAAEMQILQTNVEFSGGKNQLMNLDLETSPNNVNPFLAIAAIDSLESKNTLSQSAASYDRLRSALEVQFSGEDNPIMREFDQTFGSFDTNTQAAIVEWMYDYPSLTSKRENGLSVIEMLTRTYPQIKDMAPTKPSGRTTSRNPRGVGYTRPQTPREPTGPQSLADLPDKGVSREDLRSVARAQIKQALAGGMSVAALKKEIPYQYLSLVDEVAASI
jgi:hypothetical protein